MVRDQRVLSLAVQMGFLSPEQAQSVQARRQFGAHQPIEQELIALGYLSAQQIQALYTAARQNQGTPAPTPVPLTPPSHGSRDSSVGIHPPSGSHIVNSKESHKSKMAKALQGSSLKLEEGDSLGPYLVVKEIARGGMGAVFLAQHLQSQQRVALKLMLAGEDADERQITRFEREIAANSALRHPNIVQILDSGRDGRLLYYTMELVSGGSLERLLEEEVSLEETVAVMAKLAHGVGHAHGQGIFHRDLKPPNVLLTEDLEPKVTDFGLAKSLLHQSDLTKTGSTLGTPTYMAPEQVRGETKSTDQRCDVWALGIIFYECLAGFPPFKADMLPQLYDQILKEQPVSITRFRPETKNGLNQIIAKCIEKDPNDRYSNATELARDLETWLRDGRISVAGQSQHSKLIRGLKKSSPKAIAMVSVIVLLLIATPLGVYWLATYKDRRAKQTAKKLKTAALHRLDKVIRSAKRGNDKGEEQLSRTDLVSARGHFEAAKNALHKGQQVLEKLPPELLEELQRDSMFKEFHKQQAICFQGISKCLLGPKAKREQVLQSVEYLKQARELAGLSKGSQSEILKALFEGLMRLQHFQLAAEVLNSIESAKHLSAEQIQRSKIRLWLENRQPGLALKQLKALGQAIDEYPLELARALSMLGQHGRATDILKAKAALRDSNTALRIRLKNRDETFLGALMRVKERQLERSPDLEAFVLEAEAYVQAQRPYDAVPRLKQLLQRHPHSIALIMALIEALHLTDAGLHKSSVKRHMATLKEQKFNAVQSFQWQLLTWRLDSKLSSETQQKRWSELEKAFQGVREHSPSRRQYSMCLLAQCMNSRAKGDKEAAAFYREELKRLAGTQGDSASLDARAYLAVFMKSGEAEALVKKALQQHPQSTLALFAQLRLKPSPEHRRQAFWRFHSSFSSLCVRAERVRVLLRRARGSPTKDDQSNALVLSQELLHQAPWAIPCAIEIIRYGARSKELRRLAKGARALMESLHPDDAFQQYRRGLGLYKKNVQDSLKATEQSLKSDPRNIDCLVLLARLQHKQGKHESALKILNRALELDARFKAALKVRIKVAKALKKTDVVKADQALVKGLDNPSVAGKGLEGLGDINEDTLPIYIEKVRHAKFLCPRSTDILFKSAIANRAVKKEENLRQAFHDFASAFLYDLNALDEPAFDFRSLIRYTLSSKSVQDILSRRRARNLPITALDAWSDVFILYLNVVNGYKDRSVLTAAMSQFDRVLLDYPENIGVRTVRAAAKVLLNDESAESDLKMIVKRYPDLSAARMALALLSARRRDLRSVFKHFEKAKYRVEVMQHSSHFPEFKDLKKDPRWQKLSQK